MKQDRLIQEIEHRYLSYAFILNNPTSTKEGQQAIIDFIIKYNRLLNINDYLTEEAKIIFGIMSKVMNFAFTLNQPNNEALTILKEYVDSCHKQENNDFVSSLMNNDSGKEKATSLARTSKTHPSVISEDLNMNKTGFFSFLGLLFVVLHFMIILAILAIKK